MIILFVSNGLLTGSGVFYELTFLGQVIFYGLAAYVSLSDGTKNKWFGLINYFCLINVAAAMAFIKFLKGEKIVIWKPRVG
jgi:hypothetical protein